MRLRLALTLDIERATRAQNDDYREVDIPGTQTERLPDDFGPDARRVGFTPQAEYQNERPTR